jgi:hypothetical protein
MHEKRDLTPDQWAAEGVPVSLQRMVNVLNDMFDDLSSNTLRDLYVVINCAHSENLGAFFQIGFEMEGMVPKRVLIRRHYIKLDDDPVLEQRG